MLSLKILNFLDVQSEFGQVEKEKMITKLGGTIGRSNQCDWSLSDNTRRVSNKHFVIESQYGEYYLTDVSTNGSKINGSKVEKNVPLKLKEGDLFELGLYKIKVSKIETKQTAEMNDFFKLEEEKNQTLDFLNEKDLSKESKNLPFEKSNSDALYHTRDPFAQVSENAFFDPSKLIASEVNKETIPDEKESIIQEFSTLEDLEEISDLTDPGSIIQENKSINLSEPSVKKTIIQRKQENTSTEFLDVLCNHLGLDINIISQLDQEKVYQDICDLLTYSLDGVIQLMMERNSAKNKYDSDLTMFQAQVKNPLKMSMNSKQAIETILYDKNNSSMSARQAVGEAFQEIGQHHKKVESSVRATLEDTLKILNPSEVEKEVTQKSKKRLTLINDAKCWQVIKQKYNDLFGQTEKQKSKNIKEIISDHYNK